MMFACQQTNGGFQVSKTAAALNYWLQKERFDLPLAITQISHASYNIPISADGTLPLRLFDRPLNLKRLKEKKIPWLICYGVNDDLVEKETALAPLDYIDAEVTPFPKGHVAIATSWSHPESACGLHTRFGEGNWRGPVRFHMDLEAALTKARGETPAPAAQGGKGPSGTRKKASARAKSGKTAANDTTPKKASKGVPKTSSGAASAKKGAQAKSKRTSAARKKDS